jgi:hypothetical protein
MIIWRGWGILVVLICGLGGGLAGGLSKGNLIAVGLGLAASAAGIWFLGRWLNQTRPKAAYEAAVEYRSQELKRMVEVGAYQFSPSKRPMLRPRNNGSTKRRQPAAATSITTHCSSFLCTIGPCWRGWEPS